MAERYPDKTIQGERSKGKCSNERGVTCASNVGKTLERIINERGKREGKMTDMQGGRAEG